MHQQLFLGRWFWSHKLGKWQRGCNGQGEREGRQRREGRRANRGCTVGGRVLKTSGGRSLNGQGYPEATRRRETGVDIDRYVKRRLTGECLDNRSLLLWPGSRQPNLRRCCEETSQVMEREEANKLAQLLRYSNKPVIIIAGWLMLIWGEINQENWF